MRRTQNTPEQFVEHMARIGITMTIEEATAKLAAAAKPTRPLIGAHDVDAEEWADIRAGKDLVEVDY